MFSPQNENHYIGYFIWVVIFPSFIHLSQIRGRMSTGTLSRINVYRKYLANTPVFLIYTGFIIISQFLSIGHMPLILEHWVLFCAT